MTMRERFEQEYAAFVRARDQGGALQMYAVAMNLRRIAGGERARSSACALIADASLRLGKTDENLDERARLPQIARLLLDAKESFLRGELREAETGAQAALDGMTVDDPQRLDATILVSETRLARGAVWIPPAQTAALALDSWERIALDAQWARHLARTRMWVPAQRLAHESRERAVACGYLASASRAAAVLYHCARARGEEVASRRWRAEAVEHLLRTQDFVVATGLFFEPAYGVMDALLGAALYRRLLAIVPQMHRDSAGQRVTVIELLRALLDRLDSLETRSAPIEAAYAMMVRSDSAFAHYAPSVVRLVAEMLALSLVSLSPLPWNGALVSLLATLTHLVERFGPPRRRAISIVLPQWSLSQSNGIDHLRVDEQPGGGRSAAAAISRVRLRLLPVRPRSRNAVARRFGVTASGTSRQALDASDSG